MSTFKIRTVEIIDIDRLGACRVFGAMVKDARKAKGLTQEGLSYAIGTSRAQLANLETGKTFCGLPVLIRLICVLDMHLSRKTFIT